PAARRRELRSLLGRRPPRGRGARAGRRRRGVRARSRCARSGDPHAARTALGRCDPGALARGRRTVIALALAAALQAPQESDAYTVDWLKPPEKEVLEVGGMGFLPDGRLALSTRRGQVWIVENPLAENPDDAHFTLFADGLQEGLGLAVVDGGIDVLQR